MVTALSATEERKLAELEAKATGDLTVKEISQLLEMKRKKAIPAAALKSPSRVKKVGLFEIPPPVTGEVPAERV